MPAKRANPATPPLPGQAWTWLILVGVLAVIMVVLSLTTLQRIRAGEALMVESLTRQGYARLRSLESAARAALRQGMWQGMMLQALVEEMAEHHRVMSISVLGPQGEVLAVGSRQDSAYEDPLAGLGQEAVRKIREHQPLDVLLPNELVMGRPFEPFRRGFERESQPEHGFPPGLGHGLGMGHGRRQLAHPPALPPEFCPPGQAAPLSPEPGARQPGAEGQPGSLAWRLGEPVPQSLREYRAYALARLSTEDLLATRHQTVRQALLLAGLIFLGAGAAAWGLWAAARWRSAEIERLRKEVAESQHLAALGRLAGSVAHEVRNPLSALRGLVQYLAKDYVPGSKKAEYADAAVEEVDRLERVVSGLLDYTRPKPPRRFPLDMAESIESALTFMADDPRAKGITITRELQAGLPPVSADPDQIRQVLVNLVVNALEALNGRGRLFLTARAEGKNLVVTVEDDGPGLPPGDPEQVFDPFFSGKERGTGLGLAIARRIMQAHDGEIAAGASERGGAKFTLILPTGAQEA